MIYDGKEYRNLESQVGYLTGKWKDLQDQINDVRANLTKFILVDTLPTGDDIDKSAIYLLGPYGTSPNTYYEEWVYVETDEDTWEWEKLGDTASVDLSGYLQKVTTATTYKQVYVKNADGTQGMVDAADTFAGVGTVVLRTTDNQIYVPDPPTANNHATGKKYVDDNFLAKQTGVTTNYQAYVKKADGTQMMVNLMGASDGPNQIPMTVGQGQINVPNPTNQYQAVNLGYADGRYVAKVTEVTSFQKAYGKATDGSQVQLVVNGTDMDASSGRLAYYGTDGRLRVGTPVNDKDAATKKYVDDAVGQLLYLHSIYLVITVDASNYLIVRAHLINGSATAITSLDRSQFARLEVDYGCFGPDSSTSNVENNTTCAVTKMADSFRFNDFTEGYWGFLYQYMSGGSLVSDFVGYGSTITVTDTVISF